tara:strand:+ start:77 stop:388 length:312 start_codon:yes stop_codon:yes gene_type:complete
MSIDEIAEDVYQSSLTRLFANTAGVVYTVRDAAVIEASHRGFVGNDLIEIVDYVELIDDRARFIEYYSQVHGVRPCRNEIERFTRLSSVERIIEIGELAEDVI